MFYSLFQALFGVDPRPQSDSQATTPVEEKEKSSPSVSRKTVNQPQDFDADVERLEAEFGPIKTGLCIDTTLQKLLTICPRNRQRTDAYRGLVAYLKEQRGVTLNITSRKKKK